MISNEEGGPSSAALIEEGLQFLLRVVGEDYRHGYLPFDRRVA